MHYSFDGLYIGFDISSFKDDLIANLVTQSFLCFWVNHVFMFLSQCNIVVSSPRWIFISSPVRFIVSPVVFVIFPVKNLFLGLIPQNFWKFNIFPGESSSPHRGTDTRCVKICSLFTFLCWIINKTNKAKLNWCNILDPWKKKFRGLYHRNEKNLER